MQIVFGYGINGKKYIEKLEKQGEEYLIYDNDRRKWEDISISLSQLLCELENSDTTIIDTTSSPTGALFLKDLCAQRSNKVFKYDGNRLYEMNFNLCTEIKNIRAGNDYNKTIEYYSKIGNEKAACHAKEYADFYRKYPDAPYIVGIEVTNCCNLSCENCPTPTSKRKKGFISDEVFYEACKYVPPDKDLPFYMHVLGEPLLHPRFTSYLNYIIDLGVGVCVSTNGILFTGGLLDDVMSILQRADNSILYISFHTKNSVRSWYECCEWIKRNKNNTVHMYGQILEHNAETVIEWLKEYGVDDPTHNNNIRIIKTHTFAGNVKNKTKDFLELEIKNRIRNCVFVCGRQSLVSWDGRLMGCCYDSELETDVGSVFNMCEARTSHKGYQLCNHCDPNWTANYQ